MANKDSVVSKTKMNRRTLLLMLVCGIVAFIVLGARLYKLQIVDHDYYEQMAVEQQTSTSTVAGSRGGIFDRNGNALAISAPTKTIFISPHEMEEYKESPSDIARGLSEILSVDYDKIMEMTTNTKSWYKVVQKKVEDDLCEKVQEFKSQNGYKSIHFEDDSKRYYPNDTLACHVIGFVGTDGYGLEGLENVYNDYLKGTSGSVVKMASANGLTEYASFDNASDGYTVNTTVDITIQNIAEKHLKQAIEDYSIQNGGCCIVMYVKTGEILAMVSEDDFDPNNFLAVSDEVKAKLEEIEDPDEYNKELVNAQYAQWRNSSISDTYEPGSVFKIITMAMALDSGAIHDDDVFNCSGTLDVMGRDPVECWKTAGHGQQSLKEAAMHSCNVAFVEIAEAVGADLFYEYCESFGLFDKTGIDLEGEAGSQWWEKSVFCDPLNLSQLAAASFGETFNITPIQMITAVCAAVNGGYLMEPYLVSSIIDSDGNSVYTHDAQVVRQVISEEVSAEVCDILAAVVNETGGTGANAAVAGYSVGGKTGTTTKTAYEAATGERQYMVSFCGIAPMDNPQVAVLLVLDNPARNSGTYISGGQMAAPAVSKILTDLLPYLGIDPVYTEEQLKLLDVSMPNLMNKSIEEARTALIDSGLEVRIVGAGETVTAQLPQAYEEVAAGSTVTLYAGEEVSQAKVTVPSLHGMTVKQARKTLSDLGLFLDTTGALPFNSNVVVSTQTIAERTEVEYGTVVSVTLVDESNLGIY